MHAAEQVSYLIVDEMHHEHPELLKDQYWDDVFPTELPYTVAAEPFREKAPEASTANIAVSAAQGELTEPFSLKVDSDLDKLVKYIISSHRLFPIALLAIAAQNCFANGLQSVNIEFKQYTLKW